MILTLPPEGSVLEIRHGINATDVGTFTGVQPAKENGRTWRDRQNKIILTLNKDNVVHICVDDVKKVNVVTRKRGKNVVVVTR